MRCLSPHKNYSIQVIEGEEQIVVDARGFATTIALHKPFIADFNQTGLTEWEELAVFERFTFSGLAEGINPLTTIGVYDTEAACMRFGKDRRDEINVQVDKRLRELQALNPSQFIIVDPPEAPKPWPSYDEMSVEDILKFQEVLRIEPDQIRLYELENANRDEVVLAMLTLSDPGAAKRYQDKLEGKEVDDGLDFEPGAAPGLSDTTELKKLLADTEPPKDERVIVDA